MPSIAAATPTVARKILPECCLLQEDPNGQVTLEEKEMIDKQIKEMMDDCFAFSSYLATCMPLLRLQAASKCRSTSERGYPTYSRHTGFDSKRRL